MAVNTKALKARIRSVDSTMHITKAMELVASSKIKRARVRMEEGRFYRTVLAQAFSDLAASDTVYSRRREGLPAAVIVIAGDRGLAGGYNSSVFKLAASCLQDGDFVIPVGRRAAEYYAHRAYVIPDSLSFAVETLSSSECAAVAAFLKKMYDEGRIGSVRLVSTAFCSMLTQEPAVTELLPLSRSGAGPSASVLYEPDPETVLAAIIPEYIAGVLYSAACEAFASELAARRSAMDTATKNASAMIDELNLKYNRARQGAITQEITEIVAGSNA
ncbi:MAG: ATP synthase F1 subunit gamma [Eubacteriales bacterium]